MRLFKSAAILTTMLTCSTPAFASSCDMWGEARANRNLGSFDLKAMAEAAKKNEFRNVRNCYGTEMLKTDITMAPFGFDGPTGSLEIASSQTAASSQTSFVTGGKTYKLRTRGERSELLGNDDKWHNIADLNEVMPPLQAMKDSFVGLEQNAQWMKRESDAHWAPIGEAMTVVGLGGMMSALSIPTMLQYAPLADSKGINEQVGGYSTTIWEIDNKKAEMYAASRGLTIDTTGSRIRYWVTDKGLVIKIDATFGAALMDSPQPVSFKYRVAKSDTPDFSWWD